MTHMGPSWRGIAVVALVVAAVLAGVALLSGGGSALDDAAAAVEGEPMQVRFDIQIIGGSDSLALSGTGDFSADRTSGVAEVLLPGPDGEAVDATVRLIRNDVWVSPSRHDALPRGKRWIHSTLEGKITPAGFVRLLEDIGDVEDRGEVTAAGTRCTRYRGSVDVATLLDRVGPGVAEQARISHDRFPRVPAEACVAADGTPKLLVIAQTEPGNGLRLEAEFLGFGREVDVRPPAPSQVVEASKKSG